MVDSPLTNAGDFVTMFQIGLAEPGSDFLPHRNRYARRGCPVQIKSLTIGLWLLSSPCLALSFFTLHVNSQGKVFQKGGEGGCSATQDVSCVFNKAAERYETNMLVRMRVDGDTKIEDVWRILEAGTASRFHSYIVTEHNVKITTGDLFYEMFPNYNPGARNGDSGKTKMLQLTEEGIHNTNGNISEHGAGDRKCPVDSNRSDHSVASPRERSFDMAIQILGRPYDDSAFDKIGTLLM